MQVPILSIVFMFVSTFISIGLPIVLFYLFYKKYSARVLPLIFGILVFTIFIFTIIRNINILVITHFTLLERPFLFILYGVLMAGIFEETARFISFKVLQKKYNKVGTALAYGIGHGGIEAVLIVGLTMIANIVFSFNINVGGFQDITGDNAQIVQILATTPPIMFLAGGIERISVIGIHLSLSVLVFYSVISKDKLWLFPLAILIHILVNIPAGLFQTGLFTNLIVVQVIILTFSLVLIFFTKRLHEKISNSNNTRRE
ncbi:MAG: YhfC family intramembrane metalloprotease [Treponema sp.]|nr:YhfC family intramembrane metalloprotease [Treponema sp.]